jgi:hypothetical protein
MWPRPRFPHPGLRDYGDTPVFTPIAGAGLAADASRGFRNPRNPKARRLGQSEIEYTVTVIP